MHKCEPDFPLPVSFSRNHKWLLFLITLSGAVIRVVYLYDRSFTGDEIGTLIYIKKDIPYLLSHFATWLSMNYYIVLEKLVVSLFGSGPFSVGFISLAAGIGMIPLTAFLSVRFTSSRVALSAAAFISMNPYLIQYSGVIRSYSLLAAFSTLLMILFFKWQDIKSYKHGITVAIVSFILILAHPNGAYTIAFIALMVAFGFFNASDKSKYLKSLNTLIFPLTITGICAYISYYKILPDMQYVGLRVHDISPTSISYVTSVFSEYSSGSYYGWLSAAFFITGILVVYKYEKPVVTLLPAIFLPILLISMQGLSHFPWGYARFLIFIVPIIIIIIAEGIEYYSSKYFSSRTTLVTAIMVAFLILSWLPRLIHVFDDKNNYPWQKVASFIKQNYSEQDIIVGNDWVEPFHLRQYYPEQQNRILSLGESLAQKDTTSANSSARMFYVTYSYSTSQLAFPTLPESHFVKTTQPVKYFGKIQVIIYTASPEHSVQQKIRSDLINTVKDGEELAPEFTSIYKNIWDINNIIGGNNKNFCYYNLSIKCSELAERQKNAPRSLRIWQIGQGLKDCR